MTEAVAAEEFLPPPTAPDSPARTALDAAHTAYQARFGHAFVICLDGLTPGEALDQTLAALRTRMAHDIEDERQHTADELRRLARGRLIALVRDLTRHNGPRAGKSVNTNRPDSPYVPV